MLETDTLIVGGGPAGSICGIRLMQEHKDCIIVDRATFPRLKLCAGVLTAKSRSVLRTVLGEDKLSQLLQKTQVSHESHMCLWERKHCFVDCDFSNSNQIPQSLRNEDWRFVLVDRPKFDAWLTDYYKSLGGKMLEGDGVHNVDFEGRVAELASGEKVHYNKLVACDGATSHVEKLLAKYDKAFKPKGNNAEAFEINVDREDLDIDGINVCFGYVPKTYAWAFAKGDKICLGTCRLDGCHFNGRDAMKKFCDDLGLKHQEKYPLKGAMIPFDNAMPVPLWREHLYFCGDAAGLDEAVTGEGICYALRSGVDAAECIIKSNPLLYLKLNQDIQALMHKAAKYQKLLANPLLYKVFKAIASADDRFVGYFYLTQIDHSSLSRVWRIIVDYTKALRLNH